MFCPSVLQLFHGCSKVLMTNHGMKPKTVWRSDLSYPRPWPCESGLTTSGGLHRHDFGLRCTWFHCPTWQCSTPVHLPSLGDGESPDEPGDCLTCVHSNSIGRRQADAGSSIGEDAIAIRSTREVNIVVCPSGDRLDWTLQQLAVVALSGQLSAAMKWWLWLL